MAFGFGVLKLDPDGFWSMTPREIAAAINAHHMTDLDAPSRKRLVEMMRIFPDMPKEKEPRER